MGLPQSTTQWQYQFYNSMKVQTVLITVSSVGVNKSPFSISDNIIGILTTVVPNVWLIMDVIHKKHNVNIYT